MSLIGNKPNQVPTNGDLGSAAYVDQDRFYSSAVSASNRNLIINGGMNIWQRATSHTTASGYNSVDRWSFNTYTGGAFTVSKEVDSVHGDYLKWNRTAQDTSNPNAGNAIQQAIENAQYVVGGQYITVSFWLKDEAGLGSGFVRVRQGASPYVRINTDNTDGVWVSSSTAWEYHTFTFQVKSAAEIAMPNIHLLIQMDNGTAQGGVSITKVQLEVGSVATPFEHRQYGQELALCQRYFQKVDYNHNNGGLGANWYLYNIPLLVEMRAPPTLSAATSYNSDTGSAYYYLSGPALNGWVVDSASITAVTVRGNSTSVSQGLRGRGWFNSEL